MSTYLDVLRKQEELLQFDSFNYNDAYKLGCFMADYALKNNIEIAISIRMNTGYTVFQYGGDGTNLLNQIWMGRKFNTVKLLEQSSLLSSFVWEQKGGGTRDTTEYAICGGGFPIRLKGSQVVIGAIISSNLDHISDHEFIIDCLREYLNVPEVPSFPREEVE